MTKSDDPILVVTHERPVGHTPDVDVFTGAVTAALGATSLRLSAQKRVRADVRAANPARVVYIAPPGAFADNLLVFKRLHRQFGDARCVMVQLCPLREHDRPRWPARMRCADPILVLSYRSLLALARLSLKGDVIPMGVDTALFHPPDAQAKKLARARLDIDATTFIFLWDVDAADADAITEFKKRCPDAAVIALPAGGPLPAPVKDRLDTHGIKSLDPPAQLPEILWAADALVFARSEERGAVETPPMVLAALAAGLPVLTRPVGGLPDFLEQNGDVLYWNTMEELLEAARRTREVGEVRVRSMNAFSWDRVAGRITDVLGRATDRELAVPGR